MSFYNSRRWNEIECGHYFGQWNWGINEDKKLNYP